MVNDNAIVGGRHLLLLHLYNAPPYCDIAAASETCHPSHRILNVVSTSVDGK